MTSKNCSSSSNRMPTDPHARRLLRQHAQQLACKTDTVSDQETLSYYIRVSMGDLGLFDIPRQSADEVVTSRGMARVPCTPAHFAGVISLRGEMIAVLDLPAFFGFGKIAIVPVQPILIVKGGGMTVGLLLEDVESEVTYGLRQMEPSMAGGGIDHRFVAGIHEGRVTVLNIEAILSNPDLILDT